MSLGSRLKSLRIGRGASLQKAADALGMSKPHLWELETGKSTNPSLELLTKLAKHYRTTVAYLVGETEESGAEAMVFGREFKNATEEDKKLIVDMTEKLIGKAKRGR
jgi:transcriptional regulator with XRE-family HTH domain